MYTLTPSQCEENVIHAIEVGLTPIVTGSPGVSKSAIMRKIAKKFRLKLIDVRLSTYTPEDLNGLPMRENGRAVFTPFDTFPIEGDPLPKGYDGWMIFLDEITSALKPVQAAAYKLVLDRMVGNHNLHPNVVIVAAGNKATDNAVVNKMSTALQSRFIHLEMEPDKDEWIKIATEYGYDHRVASFISFLPTRLMDFRPDHQDKTFPCPRTWEFVSKLVKGREITPKMAPILAGTVGAGAAREFMTFAQEFDRLPKLADILAAPKHTPVPSETSTKYATAGMLMENFDLQNLDAIIQYMERFDIEMQILFCRGAVGRMPEIRTKHPKFIEYLRVMVKYLQ